MLLSLGIKLLLINDFKNNNNFCFDSNDKSFILLSNDLINKSSNCSDCLDNIIFWFNIFIISSFNFKLELLIVDNLFVKIFILLV